MITMVCVALIAATILVTVFLVRNNSTAFSVTTAFNSTVMVPLKPFLNTYTIPWQSWLLHSHYTYPGLPCNTLNANYKENQTSNDIRALNERYYIYLLQGSVFHFKFEKYTPLTLILTVLSGYYLLILTILYLNLQSALHLRNGNSMESVDPSWGVLICLTILFQKIPFTFTLNLDVCYPGPLIITGTILLNM